MTKDLGYDGIEVRGIENELYAPNSGPFLPVNIEATKATLRDKNIEIPCLTSASYIFDKKNIEREMKEGIDYIYLAQNLGVKYVRVLGDEQPYSGENIDIDFVAKNLKELANYADGRDVTVLIETNGVFADSQALLSLLEKVNKPNVGVLWDIHHPYRYMDEPVKETYDRLKKYIKHIHLKDSLIDEGKVSYKMIGYGDLPIVEVLELLKSDNYSEYISLEWVKRWDRTLEAPAIAFPHFISYVKRHI